MMYVAPAGHFTTVVRRIRLFGATAALCAVGLLGLIAVTDYRDRHEQAETGTLARSRILAEHASLSLETVQVTLTQISSRLTQIWRVGNAPGIVLHELLQRHADAQPMIQALSLVGPDGQTIVDSRSYPAQAEDFSTADFMRRFTMDDDGAAISLPAVEAPLLGEATGHVLIPCLCPMSDSAGGVRAILVAQLDPRFFEGFYQTVNDARPMDTGLILASGEIVASSQGFPKLGEGVISAALTDREPIWGDGLGAESDPNRVINISAVADWPLLAVTALDRREVLKGWYWSAAVISVIGMLIAVGTAVFVRLIARKVQNLSEAEAELFDRISDLEISQSRLEDQGAEMVNLAEALDGARRDAERAKAVADEANRAKSEFLARMSHELRTPLNAILGFSEIIRDHLDGPESWQSSIQYAADIHESGSHLLSVINDILDLAKVEAGRFELAEEEVDLHFAVQSVNRLVRETAHRRQLSLDSQIGRDIPRLRSDMRVLRQMLLNLLSNSLKFTPAGGRISVSASLDHGGITIQVSDTGIGIAEDDLARVLEPFGQGKSQQPNGQEQGTGLGLPLVKSFIERHDGVFHLSSTVGVGTTVSLWFPPDRVVDRAACAMPRASSLIAAQ